MKLSLMLCQLFLITPAFAHGFQSRQKCVVTESLGTSYDSQNQTWSDQRQHVLAFSGDLNGNVEFKSSLIEGITMQFYGTTKKSHQLDLDLVDTQSGAKTTNWGLDVVVYERANHDSIAVLCSGRRSR